MIWLVSRRRSRTNSGPKLVGASRTATDLPGASQPRGVANASSRPRGRPFGAVSCTSISRSVSRNAALEAAFGGRYIERKAAPLSGATVAASPETNVSGRHRRAEHAVEAEHELVRLVVVGEEPRDLEPVDLVGAGDRVTGLPAVERVGAGAHEPEQPRAVGEHVAEDLVRLRAVRLEEPGREGIWHHQVPVAAEPGRGDRVVRLVLVEQHRRDEQRPVLQPMRGRRTARRSPVRAGSRAAARVRQRGPVPGRRPDRAIALSPSQTIACECSP